MNAFIIHSGVDYKIATERVEEIKKRIPSFNALVLKNTNCLWKIEARRKIKNAQIIVFFVGKKSHESKNIGWEIDTAIKYQKPIYTIDLEKGVTTHGALSVKNEYSGNMDHYHTPTTEKELIRIIEEYNAGDYGVLNGEIQEEDKKILFEQYKIFLKTSEDLVARRQNLNSFYISINSLVVTLFGAVLAFNFQLSLKLMIGLLFCFVGIVLSASWIKMLTSYGNLNGSKFTIVKSLEKKLPASLYSAEWAALSDKLNKKKYVSFTKGEKRIPVIFIIMYSVLTAGLTAYVLVKYIKA